MCVHLLGYSKNIVHNMALIQNLLWSYADSETKDKTIFVMDIDAELYKELYEKFSSCIDRYFRVLYYPSSTISELMSLISKSIEEESLAKCLADTYLRLSQSPEITMSEETLSELLSDYRCFVSTQTTQAETTMKSLKSCLTKHSEIVALKTEL